MTALATDDRPAGWYRYAGTIDRWWDGYGWTDHYQQRQPATVPVDPDPADVELAVAEPVEDDTTEHWPEWADDPEPVEPPPAAVPQDDEDDTTEDTVVDAPSPAPRTARRRVRALRRPRPAHAATYCPHTAADPIGDDMNSQAAQLAQQLIAAMGFDPNDVTSVHVARTDRGLEAAVTYILPGSQVRTADAPQTTEFVHLGY